MRNRTTKDDGKLAFMPGEYAAKILPSAWRLEFHEKEEQELVRKRFGAFLHRLGSVNRHHILSLTGLYTLIGAIGALQQKSAYPEVAEMEFLQAVVLNLNDDYTRPLIEPNEIMPLWRELSTQCYVANIGMFPADIPALEGIARVQAAFYRNPYGDEFFDRMVTYISKDYDDRFSRDGRIEKLGLSLVAIRQMLWNRFQNHIDVMRISIKGNRTRVLEQLRLLNENMDEETFNKKYLSLDMKFLRSALLQLKERRATEVMFVIDSRWIAEQEANGLPMNFVLEKLTLDCTSDADVARLGFENPVWSAPVMRYGSDYAVYNVLTITSFPFRCLMKLLSADLNAKARIEKVRGSFVEAEAERLLREALPSALVIRSGYWHRSDGERVETDLLVLVAKRLFIFEAKGALIPDRVRFGARDATAQFLKKIWGNAISQSAEFGNHLKASSKKQDITDEKGSVLLTLDPSQIRSISRFGLSIDQVGPLMSSPSILKSAGVLSDTAVSAPCILLSELSQVLHLAKGELAKLHYLLRRHDLAQKYEIIGDEMDIFTTYIQFGFSELPEADRPIVLLGASYSLDEFKDSNDQIVLPRNSALRNSSYFDRLLRRAQARNKDLYLEIGLMLMDMSLRVRPGSHDALAMRRTRSMIAAA